MSILAKISTATDERSARLAGIGLMLLSMFMFSFGDALGKFMVATYSVGQLLWLRACAALIVLLPLIWRNRADFTRLERPWLQLLRVTLSTLEVAAFFLATVYLPLAAVGYRAARARRLEALERGPDRLLRRIDCAAPILANCKLACDDCARRQLLLCVVDADHPLAAGGPGHRAGVNPIRRHVHAWRAAVAIWLGHTQRRQPWPVCRGRMYFGERAVVRQPVAETRTGKRCGALPIFDGRVGGDVRLFCFRRRALDGDDRRGGDHHRRRSLHFSARTQAGAQRGAGKSAGLKAASGIGTNKSRAIKGSPAWTAMLS